MAYPALLWQVMVHLFCNVSWLLPQVGGSSVYKNHVIRDVSSHIKSQINEEASYMTWTYTWEDVCHHGLRHQYVEPSPILKSKQ